MRRLTIGLTAAVMLLALAPAGALGSDHHSRLRRVENARVMRFSGGVLTVSLRNGATLRGKVNRRTALECTASQRLEIVHDGDQSANDGAGDAADMNENEAVEPPENEAAEPPENEAAEPPENEVESACSPANLTPGRVVREAELRISHAGRVWKKVELGL